MTITTSRWGAADLICLQMLAIMFTELVTQSWVDVIQNWKSPQWKFQPPQVGCLTSWEIAA